MTIEDIIKSFDYIKHVGNGESTYEHCREEIALNEAVTIMRKYQKVEELYKKYENDVVTNIYAGKRLVESLEEVFENGNDD